MTITARERDGLSCPALECDWCGSAIGDLRNGNAYWISSRPDRVFFNHKRCAHAHERSLSVGGGAVFSEDLPAFVAFLLGNTGASRVMSAVDEAGDYGREVVAVPDGNPFFGDCLTGLSAGNVTDTGGDRRDGTAE